MSKAPARKRDVTIDEPLRALAHGILAHATDALAADTHPDAIAIHEFRKAMKRWRALLHLLEPFLPGDHKRLRFDARDLARELSSPRDAQSALDALEDALKSDANLSIVSLRTIRTRINETRRKAEGAALNDELRTRIYVYLRCAALAVDRWPTETIGLRDIADRLARTYRQARRRLPDAWATANAQELHDLRQRAIAHRHQMDLVLSLWPSFSERRTEETQRLRDRLGCYQDLTVLAAMTAPHRPLARWRSRLLPLIAHRQSTHVAAAARLAERLFAERPKAFRRRLRAMAKAWEN